MASEDEADLRLDQEARSLILDLSRPRRRARPRLAEPLAAAQDLEAPTASGPVAAWRLGEGPAVLLVHGWGDDNALWGPMIVRLAADGWAVVALDLPGHGFSSAGFAGIKPAAEAVGAVAAALGPIEAVIGHSFGCVALTAALDGGLKAAKAVMIASPLPRGLAARLEQERARGAPNALIDRAQAILTAEAADQTPEFDLEAAARRMSATALFVHALDDEQCPWSNSRTLAAAWPGAGTVWVDGLGHRLIAQDDGVAATVVDFLAGLPVSS